MAFVRRFTEVPSVEVLTEIEAINVIDLAPPAPSTGVGSGAVLVVGEFEDGPFAAGGDSTAYNPSQRGILEAFGTSDLLQKYGGFGFQRTANPYADPCARFGGGELWNGNGYLKLKFFRSQRLFIARADTSVGSVQLTPIASLLSTLRGPFNLGTGTAFTLNPNGAGTQNVVITATAAVVDGDGASGTMLAGDQIRVTVDGNAPVLVTFDGTENTTALIAAAINAALGSTIASDNAGAIRFTSPTLGTSSFLLVEEVVSGSFTRLGGLSTPTDTGTGNVGDSTAVTNAELAAIITALSNLTADTVDGFLRVFATTSVQAGANAVGLDTALTEADDHGGGSVPAGTRVGDGTTVWVTMQTVTFAEGVTTAVTVKVRPATDNGTALGAAIGTVDEVNDQPAFSAIAVGNAVALTVALTDAQKDAAYQAALDASLALSENPAKQANYLLMARRTAGLVLAGRDNAISASDNGHFGRKFITRAPLGLTASQAIADVALYRSDRVFYTYPGFRVRIPEIATVGANAGGQGFTDDGIITVGADAPLTTINARLPPERNPGEQTEFITRFSLLEAVPGLSAFTIDTYAAFKAAGICAPVLFEGQSPQFQSGVTSVNPLTDSGRVTQARRKMADFIQDSVAVLGIPFSKKLNTQRNRDGLRAAIESFLSGLLSLNNAVSQRIEDFVVDDVTPNTPDLRALGIHFVLVTVRTLASMDAIVFQTEIGENASIVREAA